MIALLMVLMGLAGITVFIGFLFLLLKFSVDDVFEGLEDNDIDPRRGK